MSPSRREIAAGLALWAAAPAAARAQSRLQAEDLEELSTEAAFDPALRLTGPVRVDERGPFQFVVDTGANRSVISDVLAERLGLPAGGPVELHGIAGASTVETARVREFEVAGLVTRNLQMPVLSRQRLGADGLLGLDGLGGRMVQMDFKRRRLRLFRSRPRTLSISRLTDDHRVPGETLPARLRFGQLTLVSVRSGKASISAVVDSGSQVTVGNSALRRQVRLRNLARDEAYREVPIFSVTSQTAYGELTILKTLEIGGSRILNLPVVFSDLHAFSLWGLQDTPALLLGADTLARYSILTLDFGRHQITFNP